MKVDSEEQRQILLNCINAAELSGTVKELIPVLTDIVKLIPIVQTALIEEVDNAKPEEGYKSIKTQKNKINGGSKWVTTIK
jgi:hypothetical protein